MLNFEDWAKQHQARVEQQLDLHLPAEHISPTLLHSAMRYSTLGGGKRVRALLTYAVGSLTNTDNTILDYPAMAVELIHAYSLVHDDMPCMDDDDLRRGKLSCHKAFDDATALLVGDALQSLAFELLSSPKLKVSAEHQIAIINTLAVASGSRGMAGGQAIDLASVGKSLEQTELEYMHIHKTGALIRAACLMGAYCDKEMNHELINAVDHYAQAIGLAFQVVDDILDTESDTATLGKTAGKDARENKPTYVSILGLGRAKTFADELYEQAIEAISVLSTEHHRLTQIAQWITRRAF